MKHSLTLWLTAVIVAVLHGIPVNAATELWSRTIGVDAADKQYGVHQIVADNAGGVLVMWHYHDSVRNTNMYHVTSWNKKGDVAWDGCFGDPVVAAAIIHVNKKSVFVSVQSPADYIICFDRRTGAAARIQEANVFMRYGLSPKCGSQFDKTGFFVNKYIMFGGTNVIARYLLK